MLLHIQRTHSHTHRYIHLCELSLWNSKIMISLKRWHIGFFLLLPHLLLLLHFHRACCGCFFALIIIIILPWENFNHRYWMKREVMPSHGSSIKFHLYRLSQGVNTYIRASYTHTHIHTYNTYIQISNAERKKRCWKSKVTNRSADTHINLNVVLGTCSCTTLNVHSNTHEYVEEKAWPNFCWQTLLMSFNLA